jgi:hypothetical protein
MRRRWEVEFIYLFVVLGEAAVGCLLQLEGERHGKSEGEGKPKRVRATQQLSHGTLTYSGKATLPRDSWSASMWLWGVLQPRGSIGACANDLTVLFSFVRPKMTAPACDEKHRARQLACGVIGRCNLVRVSGVFLVYPK